MFDAKILSFLKSEKFPGDRDMQFGRKWPREGSGVAPYVRRIQKPCSVQQEENYKTRRVLDMAISTICQVC